MKSSDIVKLENLSTKKDTYVIRWNMTYICNYCCDFCIQGDKKRHIERSRQERAQYREEICDNLITYIEKYINKKYSKLNIYLIGGEVTILNNFVSIIQRIVNCKFEGKLLVHITTNLSTSDDVLNKLVDIFSKKYDYPRILEMSASYYKKFVTEQGFMRKVAILYGNSRVNESKKYNKNWVIKFAKKYLLSDRLKKFRNMKVVKSDKLKQIANKIEPIHVNINYPLCNDEDYKDYVRFRKKYANNARIISFIIIRDYKESISKKLKKKLEKFDNFKKIKVTLKNGKVIYFSDNTKMGLKLENEQYFNPQGCICDAGTKTISINAMGVVSRCTCCDKKTIIGNMKDEVLVPVTDKIVCPSKRCVCSFYTQIERKGN